MKLSQLEELVKVMRNNAIVDDPKVTFWKRKGMSIDLDIEHEVISDIKFHTVCANGVYGNKGDYQLPLIEA